MCVCFFCPLLITGMGNQWVQSHSSLRKTLKRVNAACDKFRECGYGFVHLPMLSLFNPVALWIWIILSVGRIGASFIPLHARTCMCLSHVSSHVFFLNLPLSARKLWPCSGISCLKKQTLPLFSCVLNALVSYLKCNGRSWCKNDSICLRRWSEITVFLKEF